MNYSRLLEELLSRDLVIDFIYLIDVMTLLLQKTSIGPSS